MQDSMNHDTNGHPRFLRLQSPAKQEIIQSYRICDYDLETQSAPGIALLLQYE